MKITRNIGLEKTLLRSTASKVIVRRVTIAAPVPLRQAPVSLRQVTNIPFGARGRKRNTISIEYRGVTPFLDDRRVTTPEKVDDADATETVENCVGVTPGRRTYSRATSTPLPHSSRDLLPLLDPVASIDLSIASDKTDVTFLETYKRIKNISFNFFSHFSHKSTHFIVKNNYKSLMCKEEK